MRDTAPREALRGFGVKHPLPHRDLGGVQPPHSSGSCQGWGFTGHPHSREDFQCFGVSLVSSLAPGTGGGSLLSFGGAVGFGVMGLQGSARPPGVGWSSLV